jgi:hypothetical protein
MNYLKLPETEKYRRLKIAEKEIEQLCLLWCEEDYDGRRRADIESGRAHFTLYLSNKSRCLELVEEAINKALKENTETIKESIQRWIKTFLVGQDKKMQKELSQISNKFKT